MTKRLFLTALLALTYWATTLQGQATYQEAFNFRETAAYVTDGANQTYVIPADTYPITRAGATFGWTVAPTGCRDRNNVNDVRLAGICFGSGVGTFRVDLPSTGTYDINLGVGDQGSDQTAVVVKIWDDATLKLTIGPHTISTTQMYDADNVVHTVANWPVNNATIAVTFATTILKVTLETATTNSVISHMALYKAGAGGGGGGCKRALLGVGCN